VRTAATPAEARATWAAAPPALVIADYHLEAEIDGLALLESLSTASNPVARLLLTADRSPALRQQTQAAGIQLLYKPLRPAALRSYLSALAAQAEDAPK
jgi:CheY-like chemotaxis protein